MKTWQTKNGIHIYQVLKGRSNSYLIPTEKGNIFVDTGIASAYKSLRRDIFIIKPGKIRIGIVINFLKNNELITCNIGPSSKSQPTSQTAKERFFSQCKSSENLNR